MYGQNNFKQLYHLKMYSLYMVKDEVKIKCRKSIFDKVDRCAPKKLLNEFYLSRSYGCTENMHGNDILITNDPQCGWHDCVTNKLIKTDKPGGFRFKNLHHKPGETKKKYIWKRSTKAIANKKPTKSKKQSTPIRSRRSSKSKQQNNRRKSKKSRRTSKSRKQK